MFGKKNRFIQQFRVMLREQNVAFGSGLEFNRLPTTIQEQLPSVLMYFYDNGGNKHDVMIWLSAQMAEYLVSFREDKFNDTGSTFEIALGSVSFWLERALDSKKYASLSELSDFWMLHIISTTDEIPSCEAIFAKLSQK